MLPVSRQSDDRSGEDAPSRPETESPQRVRTRPVSPRRARPKAQPARITRAELRSGWAWLREFPHRAWTLLSWLWRTERRRTLIVLAAAIGVAALMGLLGTGRREIWEIMLTIGLGAWCSRYPPTTAPSAASWSPSSASASSAPSPGRAGTPSQ
ncbi:hypothetical protein [Actinomyces ruminis]|uniref:hypothetical protein n=1 Tax=Actinomyces ruminis TaxID=1937003 RepID=UPI00211EA001|nr:hypothetical protein [Actinomyces ruminis]